MCGSAFIFLETRVRCSCYFVHLSSKFVLMQDVIQVREKPQGMATVQPMGWLEAGGWIGGRHVDHNQMESASL